MNEKYLEVYGTVYSSPMTAVSHAKCQVTDYYPSRPQHVYKQEEVEQYIKDKKTYWKLFEELNDEDRKVINNFFDFEVYK
jgi:hypothetical protein